MKILKGWKTYLVGAVTVGVGVAAAMGVQIPKETYTILTGLGVIAGRDAIGNITQGLKTLIEATKGE